jgi:hypothetical protein
MGGTASANSTTSSLPKEFKILSLSFSSSSSLRGMTLGFVTFEIEAVQQRDQSRDEGADLPRRAQQRGSNKGFQG